MLGLATKGDLYKLEMDLLRAHNRLLTYMVALANAVDHSIESESDKKEVSDEV